MPHAPTFNLRWGLNYPAKAEPKTLFCFILVFISLRRPPLETFRGTSQAARSEGRTRGRNQYLLLFLQLLVTFDISNNRLGYLHKIASLLFILLRF